ncbi:DNA segregation ATPase FtsK/SpoIIIE, S-DNA-T family [Jatrophihabitans endophyticus]|uniref:DNA segregation ATPase FtsK/SpoIIIE, S-DNA-T family n=1 Tax=Jatrophihabitans endophyticus TaxID=1206085 RepID=A0A1M5LXU0_9ACTN|nr:type VII secretion protein EccCa [Jatrophihabitans endophyticus]SHG69821.1 DNA segregation ATPase FtsK/SpoIIIE, S-DNA-T family [Jatrophihabitans endophyticus]
MGTELFRRPARRAGPVEPRGEIVLESPPELPESVSGGGAGQLLTYLPMVAGAGATGLLVTGSGGSPITYLASGMMALSMVGMAFGGMGRTSGEKRRRLDGDRRDYQRYLEQVRRRVRRAAEQQRAASLWHHPDPDTLWSIVVGSRMWERRPGDEDFLVVRTARGPQRLAVALVPPETKPIEDLEPISASALRRFVRTHGTVADLPAALALPSFGRLALTGPPAATRGLARAMIAQLATFHTPDDLLVAVCAGADTAAQWEWLKWLPHALSPDTYDAVGQVRLAGDDLVEVEGLLGDLLTGRPRFGTGGAADGPHVLLVVDGGRVPGEAQLLGNLLQGVTVLDLSASTGPDTGPGILRLDAGRAASAGSPGSIGGGAAGAGERRVLDIVRRDRTNDEQRTYVGVPDTLSVVEAETLARRMSPSRVSTQSAEPVDALAADLTLPELLRIGDPRTVDPAVTWRPRAPRDRLRVPIGIGPGGQPVDLDIKESAQGGMGPHGLVIGATGSGKSELLRTLVLGLALTHSSETLNFVLVDFKGGATFASLDVLPHTSAIITNLEDELILVDRMKDAIQGEMVRRQEALRAAGNYASLRDYERAREQGAPLEPMPSLFIVVDEFSELLSAKPDFIDLFVMIGRLGRSLGVHLLLASQRLEEGKLRGLDTHLSYRVGLRTFSGMESRVVLGVPDAYELPSAPGNGYLKEATEGLVRFKAAYVSGTYSKTSSAGPDVVVGGRRQVLPYQVDYVAARDEIRDGRPDEPADPGVHPDEPAGPGETMLDILVGRMQGAGVPARKVWLPPLDVPPTLAELLPPLGETELGLRPVDWDPEPTLAAPIGLIDRPFDQRRDPHWVNLASSHFVVVGRPQSGKSTVLRSLITGLSLTHTPEQVQFFCLDFGGGTLTGLADLPHVGSVATRLEPDRLRRTIAEVNTLLNTREELFTEHRIDSMASYRRAAAQGRVPRDGFGDLFLVIDGWGTIRSDYEAMEAAITQIAGRGLGYGVHVVLSIQRWMELRPALKDLVGNRLELRLGDPSESELDRRVAKDVPENAPGRGISPHKLHFLSALPRIDYTASADDLVDGVADTVTRVQDAWAGPVAPSVRLLPEVLAADRLPPVTPDRAAVPIGVDEDVLAPVFVDFDAEPHFAIIGDVESGKSNLLRLVAKGITERWTPQEAKVITFDYRRGMLGAVTTPHQIGYVMNSVAAPETVGNIVAALRDRLSGIQVDPSAGEVPTWSGPKLFLLLDDYDLIAGSTQGNPMHGLIEFLPQARDIGLHVVLARAAGGVGQGMFEPFMRNLRDMGTPGLLLSGSKDEGAVLGSQKMEPLPPGRGRLVHRRHAPVLVQTARLGATAEAAPRR